MEFKLGFTRTFLFVCFVWKQVLKEILRIGLGLGLGTFFKKNGGTLLSFVVFLPFFFLKRHIVVICGFICGFSAFFK